MEKVLEEYVRYELEGREDLVLDRVFITHSGCPDAHIQLVKRLVAKLQPFKGNFCHSGQLHDFLSLRAGNPRRAVCDEIIHGSFQKKGCRNRCG